jgi:hypothetical protein
VKKKFFGHISIFLNPYSHETAQNFEKHVLQKCLIIAFYTYIPVNLYTFLKKHHNRCTLLTTVEKPDLKGLSSENKRKCEDFRSRFEAKKIGEFRFVRMKAKHCKQRKK